MKLISNKLRIDLDVDYELRLEDISRVKLAVDDLESPQLWIIYFYGLDEHKVERIIRVWFYESEKNRATELQKLQEEYPHIKVA